MSHMSHLSLFRTTRDKRGVHFHSCRLFPAERNLRYRFSFNETLHLHMHPIKHSIGIERDPIAQNENTGVT